MAIDFSRFEESIETTFNDKALLRQAFTHRSFINENRSTDSSHNERLEFLGDAVLELVTTDYLFTQFPDKPEGELTSYRSALVNATALAAVAGSLGMNEFLLLSHGESKDTGRARQFILADAIEALIGALYVDQGYDAAKKFITKYILTMTSDVVTNQTWLDSKSRFQEMAQEKTGVTPLYRLLRETGPDHDKHFVIGVFLQNEMIGQGEGKSKQEAEQEAAQKALQAKGW